jgi:hypothetical protein
VSRSAEPQNPRELEATFRGLNELNRIMEGEIHAAVLSCTRARRQMLAGIPTDRLTLH